MKPKQLSRTVVYENPWVNLYTDRVEFPGGRIIEKHHVPDFDIEAVAVVVENDQGRILLVHAYRYATGSIEWEIPAGGIDRGEAILDAAKREVWEESGYESSDYALLYTYYPMNGIANKVFHIARATATQKTGEFDPNEVQSYRWVSKEEIQQMIRAGKIKDGYTLTALLLYLSSQ